MPVRTAARTRLAALLLATLLAPAVQRASCQTSELPLADVLRELDSAGGMDAVARVQILHIDYAAEYRSAVSERFIDTNAQGRCEMAMNETLRTGFLMALHASAPATGAPGADLRWSAIFLDRRGIPLHRVSVNGRYFLVGVGRRGYLDGIAVDLQAGLGTWFEQTMAACDRGTK